MALETSNYIDGLVATNPTSGDPVSQADDHIRLVKNTVKATFPNINAAVTPTPTQLNRVTGSNFLIVDRAYAEYTANADISTVIPYDDTIPQNTEGTQILSVSITPKSASNRIRLRFQGEVMRDAGSSNAMAALFIAGTANALRTTTATTSNAGFSTQLALEFEHSPGSTSAQTYTIRVGPQSGTIRMNGTGTGRLFGGSMAATLVAEEIAV